MTHFVDQSFTAKSDHIVFRGLRSIQLCFSVHKPIQIRLRLLPRLVILLALTIFTCFSNSFSHANNINPATLKALYTYKFGKFTQWPTQKLNATSKHFQYCILGKNPFPQNTLSMINEKSLQGLPLNIEVFDSGLVPEEILSSCHIVFISHSEKYRLATILSSLKNAPILTVSDIYGFSNRGGMITLVKDINKLRFQINQQALQHANLTISSKIMELAEIVNERRQ